jgi:hypothetical protein
VFCQPRITPTLLSSLARRISAVENTWVRTSGYSRNHCFQRATASMVSAKPSHTQQVQFTAVKPPWSIARKVSGPHLDMFNPSITTASRCRVLVMAPPSCPPRTERRPQVSSDSSVLLSPPEMNSYLTNFNDTNRPPTPPGSQLREIGSSHPPPCNAPPYPTSTHNYID